MQAISHLVFELAFSHPARIVRLEFVRNSDVQISLFLLIWFTRKISSHLLVLFHCEDFSEVEHSLLPMSVLAMRPSREMNWFMTCGEFNVEPGYECMDEILRLSHFEQKGGLEGEIGRGDSIEVNGEDSRRVSHASLDFHCVDERLGQGCVLQG